MDWARDSRLGLVLSAADGAWLVLDGDAGRIRLASPAADGLRRAISATDGSVAAILRLQDQIRPANLIADRPALSRLRFDPRRFGPATTCFVLRTHDGSGCAVILVALAGRPPALRPPARASTSVDSEPSAARPPADALPATPRIVWRSDAHDTVTHLSGPAAGNVRSVLIDRTWAALSQARTLRNADGLLAALAERRTFRGITVTLQSGNASAPLDLDISGTPIQRTGLDFTGFSGFALVRPSTAPLATPPPLARPETDPVAEPAAPEADDDEAPVASEEEPPAVAPPLVSLPPFPPLLPVAAPWGVLPTAAVAKSATSTEAPAGQPAPTEASLSSNEHAAFREIARALGARFAGDDEMASEPAAPVERVPNGSVMPFPAQPGRLPERAAPDHDAAVAATLERLPSGVLIYRDGSVLFANRRFLDLAGFADPAGIEAWGGVPRLFGGLAPHERRAGDVPAVLTRQDGTSLSADLQASGIDWSGAPADLLLVRDAVASEPARERAAFRIARDFAARRETDALAVLDSLEDGIVTLDRNGRILGLNQSAATTFGLDPREVVGASVLGLFAPESAVAVLAGVHGVTTPTAAEPQAAPEVIGRTAAGPVPLLFRVVALAGCEDGRMAATIRDARTAGHHAGEALRLRRAAEIASARHADFLAKISHEIRTPMNGILGFADMMLAEPFGPLGHDRYRDYLADIHDSGAHVLSLVNDLLDLARIEASRLDMTFVELPLNDIVSGCVALLQPQAVRDRIVVRTSFSTDLTVLVADERSVRQATLNVIANAIQFTDAGGQVIVSTTMADRGEIALRVRNTGIGMTPEEVETALEPFRQSPVTGPRRGRAGAQGGGTGLGLPLTKALVEANRGRFRIESRKDEGTLVEMLFPAPAAIKTA